jgi:AsmA protein
MRTHAYKNPETPEDMKALKYVLYAVGALIVLLVAMVAIVAAMFDPNAYKPQIVQLVKEKTGRTLSIQGNIGLKFFPKIGAGIGKTTLSEHDSDKEFAGVDDAQVYVALWPLLSKQVVVDEVRVDGLRANLVKLKDGTTNFSDLSGGGAPAVEKKEVPKPVEAPRGESTPQQPIKLDITGIRITNSHVTWRDETNGSDVAIDLVQLKTGRLADRTTSPVDLEMTIKGVKPKADLQVKLTGMLTFDLQAQQYNFKGLDAKLTGSALDFSGITATLKTDVEAAGAAQEVKISGLSLDAKASRGKDSFDVKVTAPSIQSSPQALAVDALALSATGTVAGVSLTESSLKAPKIHVNLGAAEVLIEGLALLAKGKVGQDNLDINLNAPKLEVSGGKASGESAVLTAKLAGAERNADVKLKLSALEGSAKALKIAALTLDVDAKAKDDAVKGTFSTPVSGNLEAKIFELPKMAADFTATGPSVPQKSLKAVLSGAARADLGKERVTSDIVAKLDESNIKAKLGMTKFSAPAYDFDINIDKLNVDRYTAAKQKGGEGKSAPAKTGEAKPAEPGAKQPEQPIDLSPLKPLHLGGSVKIGDLIANNIKASNVRVDVHAKDGKLDVNPMLANLYQGSLKGSASVNANTNQIAVKQTLNGVSIGPLLRDVVQQDLLEGKGTVALDLTTAGNTVSAFKKALNGTAGMNLRDGAVKGVDIPGAIRNIKSKLGAGDSEQVADKTQKTDFSELNATFTIKNGVAHNSDLNIKSPLVRIAGEGDINIPEDSLNYVVKASVVSSLAGQGGKERADVAGLTLPVRLYGPYSAMKYKLEFSQMMTGVNKDALKETAKELLQGGGKGGLKDLGKQLLGGGGATSGTSTGGDQAAPAKKPEEQIKDRLKGLLNR